MALTDIDMKEVGRSIQLAGAVYAKADSGQLFLVLLPRGLDTDARQRLGDILGERLKAHDGEQFANVVDLDVDEWDQFLRQTDLVEVEATVQDPTTGHIAKAIVRKSARQVSQHYSWVVFRRDEFKCRYCGADDVPLTVDHLVTWESGGPSTPENLVSSCQKCNNARGEIEFSAWLMDPYYRKVSKGLDHRVKFANQALIPTLANIPRVPLKEGKKRKR